VLQVDTYAILGRPDWEADKLLKVADQNPNRAGAELVLEGYSIFDEGAEGLKKALDKGEVKTLLMAGSDYPQPDEAWSKAIEAATVVCWTSNWDETALAADLVLPLASFAEQDGTFVNVQGRLQRVKKALKPVNGRKPAVDAAVFTADALGASKDWTIQNWITAFKELKKHTNLLKDVSPLSLGPWGVLLEAEDEVPERAEETAAS
jgi:NADH-quinone oxidoreductase subunit G